MGLCHIKTFPPKDQIHLAVGNVITFDPPPSLCFWLIGLHLHSVRNLRYCNFFVCSTLVCFVCYGE